MKNLRQGEIKLLNFLLGICFTLSYLKLCSRPLLHWEWYQLKLIMLPLEDSTTDWDISPMPNVSITSGNVYLILLFLLFSLLYFANTITCSFALFLLVTIDVVYINLVKFKHIGSSCHFLELNYRGFNLNFLKLKQLLIDGDIRVKSRTYTK